jgi:DNA repair photolyase
MEGDTMSKEKTGEREVKAVGGTKEWSDSSVNCCTGCEHDCLYCYAKSQLVRTKVATASGWKVCHIRQKDVDKGRRFKNGTIMFPTSHDILPSNLNACLTVLTKLLKAGNRVLIVSKPHLDVIKTLCKELELFKSRILFRFTIGSADDKVLKSWEPGAPDFAERLASLKYAKEHGFDTSVSCEPMLDNRIDVVITAVKPYVTDSIWLGRPNRLNANIAINTEGDPAVQKAAVRLMGLLDEPYIRSLYARYGNDPIIRWKDSLKEMLGLSRPTKAGLDV